MAPDASDASSHERRLKRERGTTSLGELKFLTDDQVARLRLLSVSTAEELLGLIKSDPDNAMSYLRLDTVATIQAEIAFRAGEAVRAVTETEVEPHAMGAAAPPDVEVFPTAPPIAPEMFASAAPEEVEPGAPTERWLLDCFGEVRHQGRRGTCVAYAVCAVFECLLARSGLGQLDLSEQFVYWSAKQVDGRPQASGTLIRIACERLGIDGAPLEDLWPYNPIPVAGNEGQAPPPDAAAADAASRTAIGVQLVAKDSAGLRSAIDSGRPVALSVPVYRNWDNNPAVEAFGFIPLPLPNSPLSGGHAMCVAGYGFDADTAGGGYFVVRNSWGAAWAQQSPIAPGHGMLPFKYVDDYAWEAFTLQVP